MKPLLTVQNVLGVLMFVSALGFNAVATAQSNFNEIGSYNLDDAQSVKLGESDLFPSVRLDFLSNDNTFLDAADTTDATDFTVSPELTWVADRRLLSLVGQYKGAYNVSSKDALNFADHLFSFEPSAEFDARRRLFARAELELGHEELGRNLTRGTADADDDLVQFADFDVMGEFRYGAVNARGNVSVGLEVQNFSYTSRSDVTSGRSFVRFEPFAILSLRVSGDTRFVTELRFANFNFGASARDRNDLSLLAGMQFAATGKTGGNFRIGVLQSQSAEDTFSDQTEFVFGANLFWEPTTFSRFDLSGSREIDNRGSSLVVTNPVASVRDIITLNWRHEWSSRVSHRAQIQGTRRVSACPERDTMDASGLFELNVSIRRWLSIGTIASSNVRDIADCPSTDPLDDLDFDNTRIGAFVRATL